MVYFYLIVTEMCAGYVDIFWLFVNYAQTRYLYWIICWLIFLIEFVDITIDNKCALIVYFRICLLTCRSDRVTAQNSFFMKSAGRVGKLPLVRCIMGQIFGNVCSLLRKPDILCHTLCQIQIISVVIVSVYKAALTKWIYHAALLPLWGMQIIHFEELPQWRHFILTLRHCCET